MNLAVGKAGQHPHSFEGEITKIVACNYLLHIPEDYGKTEKQWPLMLFLHGAGQRGDNIEDIKTHGPPGIVEKKDDFPFIMISPQCPKDEWWEPTLLMSLVDSVIDSYAVDEDRIYVTGLSMGGFGTWDLAIQYPHRFAAIVPICGGGRPLFVDRIKHLPTWVFHGTKDDVVPIERSQEMVDALKSCGGNVKFTVYPDAPHNSWTETYDNPELYEWLLKQVRKADS